MRGQPRRGCSMLAALWLLGLVGVDTSDYRYKTLYFRVERPGGTCLEGRNRVLGWPSDLCDGTFNDTFKTLVDVLEHAGAMKYPGSEEDQKDLQASKDVCTNAAKEYPESGREGQACLQSELEYRWTTESGSACNNQRVHGEGEHISEGHIPQGCSLACKCCGVECESIYAFMPKMVLPGESFPAIIFLHGYTRGGLQAISEYHLDHLDARNGQPFIIITPNGRQGQLLGTATAQDDLGYPYWMGTDGFTGVYASRLNPTTGAKEHVTDSPFGQHRATSEEQYRVLTKSNPDVAFIEAVLDSMIDNLPINVNQVYLMGSGNGAELAYHVACKLSQSLKGLILHNVRGWDANNDQSQFCKRKEPLHVLMMMDQVIDAAGPQEQSILRTLMPGFEGVRDDPSSFTTTNSDPERGRRDVSKERIVEHNLVTLWANLNSCKPELSLKLETNILAQSFRRKDETGMELRADLKYNDTLVYQATGCHHGGSVVVWRIVRTNTTDNALSAVSFSAQLSEFFKHRGELANLTPRLDSQFTHWGGWLGVVWLPTLLVYACFHRGTFDSLFLGQQLARDVAPQGYGSVVLARSTQTDDPMPITRTEKGDFFTSSSGISARDDIRLIRAEHIL